MSQFGLARTQLLALAACALAACAFVGCAGTHEQAQFDDLSRVRPEVSGQSQDASAADLDRGLPGYVAYALAKSPRLRASFERYRASVYRISRARRLPEPTISFGYFLRAVETRVGPQRARISLQQAFPWPSKLSAGADAGTSQAKALARRFDAEALQLVARVSDAYWQLWQVRTSRVIHREHEQVLIGLSESVLARVETGAATLADQQQVNLAAARLQDAISGLDEQERAAEARLRAAIGADTSVALPTPGTAPLAQMPRQNEAELQADLQAHPAIIAYAYMADAQESAAQSEEADALPSFTLGGDWIITGSARMPNVPGSGKDPVMVGVGMKLPLWQGSYDDAASAARSEAAAQRAEQEAAIDRAKAMLSESLSEVRDAVRRVQFYEHTLVPQADATYASTLGAYTTGRGSVAQMLFSQRDLVELRLDYNRAQADYARSWARLEAVVGHEVENAPAGDAGAHAEGRPSDAQ